MEAKDVDRHVGQRLRLRRLLRRKSQTVLGQALGVSYQQVQKYESGRGRISASSLALAAEFLETPVEYFFSGLDLPEPKLSDPLASINPDEVKLQSDIVKLVRDFSSIRSSQLRAAVLKVVGATRLKDSADQEVAE